MSLLLIAVGALTGALGVAAPASAAPVYEIDARWIEPPTQLAPGEVVTSEWRVNVNDDAAAPSNDPVDNVVFTVTATNGVIASVPDVCLTEGVDPVSEISADGRTLTCNLGTQNMGTAAVVQVPVVADGINGSELSLAGETNGQTDDVPRIPIVATFGMDITWTGPNNLVGTSSNGDGTYNANVPLQWTLNLMKGSVAGPDPVTYTLQLGTTQGVIDSVQACRPFTAQGASDHPNSGTTTQDPERVAPFVDSCIVTPTGNPGEYTMTLTGIDYSRTQVPTQDSKGDPLPVDRDAVASGEIVVRVTGYSQAGSVSLTSNAPTYTSVDPTLTAIDDASNNTTNKTFSVPGGWVSALIRSGSGAGGSNWDDTFRLSPGREYFTNNHSELQARPGISGEDVEIQQCTVVDYAYAYTSRLPTINFNDGTGVQGPGWGGTVWYYVGNDPLLTSAPGAGYDPEAFAADCSRDAAGWTTTAPADLSTIKAVRAVHNAMDTGDHTYVFLGSRATIRNDVAPGQDIWQFSSYKLGTNPWTYNPNPVITPTPDARYPHTNGHRDLLRTVAARPILTKSADRSVARVGDPVAFTLGYRAEGGPGSPPTVDGFVITDTLPVGMDYIEGSATPEPVVTTDVDGQQTLTWTLDDVPTSQSLALTYQVNIDAATTPGGRLTNTATATFDGQTTRPATATVTTASNGTTEIGKTADSPFIPNVSGDGVGAGSWTVTLRSFDPLPQAFTDTIDILPYEGDGRGTSYSGSYELTGVVAPGATVYYTTADPGTLSDDPAAAANGAAGDPAGNTVGWTTTFTPDATAVRVIGGSLAPGGTRSFQVQVATDGAVGGDLLVNRAQARAQHTELVMRTSAPITVANYYSASLKKYVQDRNGVWHDANDVVDYPVFQYGETVRYRIVVTNTGQGTLTNINVTDDRQPALGNFQIASLAPGASESHEYSVVLDESTSKTLVNTASAMADTPPDSNVPPTIPPDPAGFEVTNYTTKKSSDPASGSAVAPGDKVTYTVAVTQQGSAPAQAVFSDDLGDVLDNATYNGDVKASRGTVSYENRHIVWNGTVPVGEVATITYSVTVKARTGGDFDLLNVVTSPGCRIVAGQTPDCTTTHVAGEFTYSKTSDPRSASAVQVGDTITYTVGVTQVGAGAVKGASITDDLSKVLDDADYNGDAEASVGTVSVAGDKLTWTGDLAVGAKVTITYSVTVVADGDDKLVNVVTAGTGGACVPAPDQNPDCTTTHTKDESFDLVLRKRVVSGTQALAGDKVRYKLQVANRGPDAAPGPIKLTDPLPAGLELVSAEGKGWKCMVARASDKVSCVRKQALGADRTAPPVFVVAVATKAAMGRVVNVAKVSVAGETVRSNNRDKASITVVPAQLPSTGFRLMPPGLS